MSDNLNPGGEKEVIVDAKVVEDAEVVEEPRVNEIPVEQPTSPGPKSAGSPNVNNGGSNMAVASLVLGILSVVLVFVVGSVFGLILGIIGLVFAVKAKKKGYVGGMRTAGFVLSLIGLIIGAITIVIIVACIGTIAAVVGAGAQFIHL